MKNITHPLNLTYWIAHNNEVYHYGLCDSENVTSTNMTYLFKYTTVAGFLNKCNELNISVEPEFLEMINQ